MDARVFVEACKEDRDSMLDMYLDNKGRTAVSDKLREANLTSEQKRSVFAAIDLILTDSFYSLLMGLAGSHRFGSLLQQGFSLYDEDGEIIFAADDGSLEGLAYEVFHGQA